MKQLAEESQRQASRIEETVAEIQTETDATVESLGETTARIDDGLDRVEHVATCFEEITETVSALSDGVAEVSRATDDRAASTEKIASMIDTAADDAVADIAAATGEQTEPTPDLDASVCELSSER